MKFNDLLNKYPLNQQSNEKTENLNLNDIKNLNLYSLNNNKIIIINDKNLLKLHKQDKNQNLINYISSLNILQFIGSRYNPFANSFTTYEIEPIKKEFLNVNTREPLNIISIDKHEYINKLNNYKINMLNIKSIQDELNNKQKDINKNRSIYDERDIQILNNKLKYYQDNYHINIQKWNQNVKMLKDLNQNLNNEEE